MFDWVEKWSLPVQQLETCLKLKFPTSQLSNGTKYFYDILITLLKQFSNQLPSFILFYDAKSKTSISSFKTPALHV